MKVPSIAVLILLALASVLRAQDSKPSVDAEEVLAAVDGRIYSPKDKGLESFRFRIRMEGTGIFQKELEEISMEISYRAPRSWKTRLVDHAGKALAKTPKIFTTQDGQNIYQAFEVNLKGMAQQFLVGLSWSDRYRDYFKQAQSYLVNDKVEYRLTLNPRKKGNASTVLLKIASGLPREVVQIDEKGARYIARFRYEKRDDLEGLCLLVGTKHEKDNVQLMEESYDYLTRKSLVLLNKVTRLVSEGETREQKFCFEDIEVNPTFPEDWFEKDERPKPAEAEGSDKEAASGEEKDSPR